MGCKEGCGLRVGILSPSLPPAASMPVQPASSVPSEGSSEALLQEGGEPLPFHGHFSFGQWASALPRLVLRSRTPFSRFLQTTFCLCRDNGLSVSTAIFPLPLLRDGLFVKCSQESSKRYQARLELRVVHVMSMALNFLHAGGRHVPAEVLRRPPSPEQRAVHSRLLRLVQACRRLTGKVAVCAGRKGAAAPFPLTSSTTSTEQV